MRYMIMGVMLGVLGFITACGGGNSTPAEPAGNDIGTISAEDPATTATGAFPALPAPADLEHYTSGCGDPAQLGSDFLPYYPHQKVTEEGDYAYFGSKGPDADSFAFAMYYFNLPDISGPQSVYFTYPDGVEYAYSVCCWIGLTNWADNTWEWIPACTWDYVDLGPLDENIHPESSRCFMVVAFADECYIKLRKLKIDDTADGPPYVAEVNHQSARAGVDLALIPTYFGTEPLEFDWELGSAFEPSTCPDREPVVVPLVAGTHDCSVTISNLYGERTLDFTIEVAANLDPWTHTISPLDEVYEGSTCVFDACTTDVDDNLFVLTKLWYAEPDVYEYQWDVIGVDQYCRDVLGGLEDLILGRRMSGFFAPSLGELWRDAYSNYYFGGTITNGYYETQVSVVERQTCYPSGIGWFTALEPSTAVGNCHCVTDSQLRTHLTVSPPEGEDGNAGYLVTLDYQGEIIRTIGWTSGEGCPPRAIIIDSGDNLYVAGNCLQATGDLTYLIKIDPDGNIINQKLLAGAGEPAFAMSPDEQRIYLYGNQGPATITALESDFSQAWTYSYELGSDTSIRSVAVGTGGDVHVIATYTELDAGEEDTRYILATITPDGTCDHCKRWEGEYDCEELITVKRAPCGQVYVIGHAQNNHGSLATMLEVLTSKPGETLDDEHLELVTSIPFVTTTIDARGGHGSMQYEVDDYSPDQKILVMRVTP